MTLSQRHFFSNELPFITVLIGILFLGLLAPRLLAFLPPLAGLGFFGYYFLKTKKLLSLDKTLLFYLITLIIGIGLSSLWSVNPDHSFNSTLRISAILLLCLLLLSFCNFIQIQKQQFFIKTLLIIFSVLTLFLLSEITLGHPVLSAVLGYDVEPHKLNRSFVVLSLLSLPVLFSIQFLQENKKYKNMLTIGMALLLTFTFYFTISQTAQLCFLVGLIFLYILPPKKFLIKLFFAGLIVLTLALPFAIKPIKNILPEDAITKGIAREASVIHRFEIWEYSVDKTWQHPILGNGLNSLRFMTADKWMTYQKSDKALHSHNIILQFWVEFGVFGAVFLIAFLIISARKMLRVTDDKKRRLYFATYAATTSCVLTGYGFWQSWHLGLLMFLAVMTVFVANINYKDFGNKNQ